jgi:cell division inhibitor SepF
MRSQGDPLSQGIDSPAQPPYRRSRLARLLDSFLFGQGPEEGEDDQAVVQTIATEPLTHVPRSAQPLRIHAAHYDRVSVRRNIVNLEDSEPAAEGLKHGVTQIINLETALPEVAERVVNFLDGVCYALDGTLEHIGSNVYLVAPANINVEVGGAPS